MCLDRNKCRNNSDRVSTVFGLSCSLLLCVLAGFSLNSPQALSQQAADTASMESKSSSESKTAALPLSASRGTAFAKPYGYYLTPILEYVHANGEQKTKITAIVQSYRSRIEPLSLEYKQKNNQFLSNVSSGGPCETLMGEQTQLGHLYSEIRLYYCQMSLDVRKVLDPEQIVRYEEFKRKQGWTSRPASN